MRAISSVVGGVTLAVVAGLLLTPGLAGAGPVSSAAQATARLVEADRNAVAHVPVTPRYHSCCVLTGEPGPVSGVLEAERESYRHVYAGGGRFAADKVGLIYTCGGGFIDLAHLRDTANLTKFYFDTLSAEPGGGTVIRPPHGQVRATVTVRRHIPPEKRVNVARAIAYAESVFHEIETTWPRTFGSQYQSSFSPEDMVSNFLGTSIAATAIRRSADTPERDFNTLFTEELESAMTRLGAVSRAETKAALDRVAGVWFRGSWTLPQYLNRRNYDVWPLRPWLVNDQPGCAGRPAAFPLASAPDFRIPDEVASYFTADYAVPKASRGPDRIDAETVNIRQLGPLVARARADGRRHHGPDYDRPDPVGRVRGGQ
jgi:hypothetical protein